VDWGKARARLGWTPRFDLEESVRLTIEWYRKYYADASCAGQVTREQLRDYAAR
jgi:CDP-glucose 4,6-dehydratase